MNKDHLIYILDEQVSVGFTGRVNILSSPAKQHLGSILIVDGEIIDCEYKKIDSLKAFFNLCVDEFEKEPLAYIVEPELVELSKKTIHYPYSVLKRKIATVVEGYRESKKHRPPEGLKILLDPAFMSDDKKVTDSEFKLMSTITDYNKVSDIYMNCELLDYEITNCLVSLRKKKALKVIKNKDA